VKINCQIQKKEKKLVKNLLKPKFCPMVAHRITFQCEVFILVLLQKELGVGHFTIDLLSSFIFIIQNFALYLH
jgi:hypothetical protein